ncbi:MAG: DUF2946 domain-containing protein [Proteobacteria bacterium]|nr:DUF2946 domain-containing protein [Pseudomonadota bacterium]
MISAAFALLCVMHFASLLPNHIVSEFNHVLFAADYGSFANFICESGKKAPEPGGKGPSCPFCKGLAAFQLAVMGTDPVVRPSSDIGQRIDAIETAHIAVVFPIRARSRGPPSLV